MPNSPKPHRKERNTGPKSRQRHGAFLSQSFPSWAFIEEGLILSEVVLRA